MGIKLVGAKNKTNINGAAVMTFSGTGVFTRELSPVMFFFVILVPEGTKLHMHTKLRAAYIGASSIKQLYISHVDRPCLESMR